MPRISLKNYLQDVSTLLANEARDEAIGHCKHILETFPKHLQTYRLLGQALFERSRLADAIDVFRRILAAVPDDRDAHLYLCEIYVGEQNYDAAIFHLERVWEQAPEDADIQDELKKLIAKRDGEAPPVLHLTAPALARRYFKGKLYPEAAAELQAILERQPERYDLLGLLAQTLWLDDRPEEATEVALHLLAVLPDHLIANRIMAELWLLMQRPSDAQPFVHRLQALDPYLAWQIVHGEGVPVPVNAFLLDRLDWRAKSASLALDASGISDIFSSLDSISLSESSAPSFDAPAKPFSGRLIQRQTGALPDYLADEQPATPAFVMPDWSETFETESAQEELPDWLADEPLAESPQASAEYADLPDWLDDSPPAAEPADATPLDAMAWLTTGPLTQSDALAAEDDFDFESLTAGTSAQAQPEVAETEAALDLDWLSGAPDLTESAQAQPEVAEQEASFDFDWLSGTPDLTESAQAQPEVAETEAALDLDWLSDTPDLTDSAQAQPEVAEPEASFDLDWLSGAPDLTESAQAQPEVAEPEAAFDLDWLSGAPDIAESAQAQPEVAETEAALDLDWLSGAPDIADSVQAQPEVAETEAALDLDWLSGAPDIADSAQAQPEVAETEAALDLDWLSGAPDIAESAQAQPEVAEQEAALDLDWLSGAPDIAESVQAQPEVAEQEAALDLDWLSGAPEQAQPEVAESEASFDLDWLSGAPDIAESAQAQPEVAESEAAFDLDWLSGAPEQAQPEVAESEAAFDLDWLAGDAELPSAPAAVEPRLQTDELAAIEADPLAWLSEFGLKPVPEPPAPHVELDESDLAELEAQIAATGNLVTSEEQPESGVPRSVAQIADALSAAAALEQLSEYAPSAPAPSPDAVVLEDEWLLAFEPESAALPPLAPSAEAEDWLETGDVLVEDAEAPEWLIEAERPAGETASLAAEADQAFDRLLEQARRAANAPRPTGDTGVLSPDSLPDWLAALAEPPEMTQLADVLASDTTQSAEPVTPPEALAESADETWLADIFAKRAATADSEATLEDFTPDWLAAPAEPAAEPPLAASSVSADTTQAQPSDAQADADDEPLTFTFRKPPAWKRKRFGNVE